MHFGKAQGDIKAGQAGQRAILAWAGSRAQRVGVFNFGTDIGYWKKKLRDGSGMDRVRVFALFF